MSFDPYHKWLGIAPGQRPPHHYALLGIPLFEDDDEVIANAADRQMMHLRSFAQGPNGNLSQRLLNEISLAKCCLLDSTEREAYDAQLQQQLQEADRAVAESAVEPAAAAPPVATPVESPVEPPIEPSVESWGGPPLEPPVEPWGEPLLPSHPPRELPPVWEPPPVWGPPVGSWPASVDPPSASVFDDAAARQQTTPYRPYDGQSGAVGVDQAGTPQITTVRRKRVRRSWMGRWIPWLLPLFATIGLVLFVLWAKTEFARRDKQPTRHAPRKAMEVPADRSLPRRVPRAPRGFVPTERLLRSGDSE